jgi:hypothetical protein
VVAQTCNFSTWETEARRSQVPRHPGLRREFEVTLNYIVRPYLKKQKQEIQSKEGRREGKGTKNRQKNAKKNGKIVDLNTAISIIPLSVNGLNPPLKCRDCQTA